MFGIHFLTAVRAGRNDVMRVRAGSPSATAAMSLASSSRCCPKAFRSPADSSRFAAVRASVGLSANSTARAVLSRPGSGTRRETGPQRSACSPVSTRLVRTRSAAGLGLGLTIADQMLVATVTVHDPDDRVLAWVRIYLHPDYDTSEETMDLTTGNWSAAEPT